MQEEGQLDIINLITLVIKHNWFSEVRHTLSLPKFPITISDKCFRDVSERITPL